MKKFMLIATDGYSIDYSYYETKEMAVNAMNKAYAELNPIDNDESSLEMSYITETSAMLYANGENVYVWEIVSIIPENRIDFNGLPKALLEFFDSNGCYGSCGNWQVNVGLDELWWVLYYQNKSIIYCKNGVLHNDSEIDKYNESDVELLMKYVKSEYNKFIKK